MPALFEHRVLNPVAGRCLLVLLVFSWLPAQAFAVFPHREGVHKEIEALEMEWRQAQMSNNVPEIDRLLANDYLGISSNGTLETKADALSVERSGAVQITQLNLSDIKIRIYGDTAVVTSKADVVGKSGNRDLSGHYRYTRVYNNRSGQWKIVSFEASRIPDGH